MDWLPLGDFACQSPLFWSWRFCEPRFFLSNRVFKEYLLLSFAPLHNSGVLNQASLSHVSNSFFIMMTLMLRLHLSPHSFFIIMTLMLHSHLSSLAQRPHLPPHILTSLAKSTSFQPVIQSQALPSPLVGPNNRGDCLK